MSFSAKAECIRKTINNSNYKDFFKFDKKTFDPNRIIQELPISSPKLFNLIQYIKELDENDFQKYGKKFKHIIYSDLRNSLAGIKLVAAAFKAYGMNNIYNDKFKITIPEKDNNFALLSSVAIYNKPFPVKLRNEILKIFNKRPDNIYGENIRYLLIDQGFKEGIDVYDVKYVHIFDDLLTPSDQKQAIGRGTRFCGQKGLEFNPELGWPLHVFKYKLLLNEQMEQKYGEKDGFALFLKEGNIDVKKLYFAAELENICRFGAVDYEINKAIHEFGNEKEDDLDVKEVFSKYNELETFKLKNEYSSIDKNKNNEFELLKKARYNFGGVNRNRDLFKPANKNKTKFGIKKNTNRFIDIKKVKPMNQVLVKNLDFIEMRKYTRKFFKDYKWSNLVFENKCVTPTEAINNNRIVNLSNSQAFVSNFFTAKSSYKGILFWHSVGTGKTCSAIATASNSFEKEDYTILWVTRHTLKPDIWKNMYNQVCSATIKEKLEKGVFIPEIVKNPLKYLDDKWITPISYKQFSNLIDGKNSFYKDLVKRNGKTDPLQKTLIIIDEAHKLFAEDTPANERPNIKTLKKAIYNSYKTSKENSCKLLLMTATPYTSNPMQLFKLLNLLKEDNYFIEDFDEFKDYYLDSNYLFKKDKNKEFLDKISGYISYLNREKDVRQFAYPVIYIKDVNMSVKDTSRNIYSYFFDDIKDYITIDITHAKTIVANLKKTTMSNKELILSQEEAFDACMAKKTKKKKSKKDSESEDSDDNDSEDNEDNEDKNSDEEEEKPKEKVVKENIVKDFVKEITNIIKNEEKLLKEQAKAQKKAEKDAEKAQKKAMKDAEKAQKKAEKDAKKPVKKGKKTSST